VTAKLTALAVKNAKPRCNRHGVLDRTWYPDGEGMYLVVQPAGAKSFALRYRFGGRTRNLKLGDVATSEDRACNGALTLAGARVRAAEARHQLERGIDPAMHKAAVHAAPGADDSVEALVAQFLQLHAHAKTRAGTAQATEHLQQGCLTCVAWPLDSCNPAPRRCRPGRERRHRSTVPR
jgi:hypothetical protein